MKLIFVYNAKSDFINKVFDLAHKTIKPNTYPCDLCNLTHGLFTERNSWKIFKEELAQKGVELVFYYKNQLPPNYNLKSFPLILVENNQTLTILIKPSDFNNILTVDQLITTLKDKLITSQRIDN